jgi:large subunit ribosomal protein L6
MSKIGRKPIDIAGVQVAINDNKIAFKGQKKSGEYILSDFFVANVNVDENSLTISVNENISEKTSIRNINRDWGLHRALLANIISGVRQEFVKNLQINGLGYKAVVSDNKMTLVLGFSHKIDLEVPKEITVEVDKTGQKVAVKSSDNVLLGEFCSRIRSLRSPEPYKGTGIKYADEIVRRKAGKTKA